MTESWIPEALAALRRAMEGEGPALEFLPGEEGRAPQWAERPEAGQAAAVVRTSGSTGTPKQTLLTGRALQASAEMTATALGGHGQWLLCLQPSYVAGLAVLTRSLTAGTEPVALLEDTTDPQRFTMAAEQLTARRRYVSLVPTQLARLLEVAWAQPTSPEGESAAKTGHLRPHNSEEGPGSVGERLLAALRRFDAILLGGAPTSPELFDAARDAGLGVIRTYGMSETCGGCIYDGYPLPGVTFSTGAYGRVLIAGPMVASGYLGSPELTEQRFDGDPATGQPRFRTDDLGELSTQRADQLDTIAQVTGSGYQPSSLPRLRVTGRADDVVITGGVKVSAEQVRLTLQQHPNVRDGFVAGVPHPQWGQMVAAVVVLEWTSRRDETFAELSALVREQLGAAAVPKHYELLGALPQLSSGKPDRHAMTRLLGRLPSSGQ